MIASAVAGVGGSSEGAETMFHQRYEKVERVYNIAGDLILTENGTQGDFVRALERLKAEVGGIGEIGDADRTGLQAELETTIEEAKRPQPDRDRVRARLEGVSWRLKALGTVASAALDAAKSVGDLASWASEHLV